MGRLIGWIKAHKLSTFLILVISYLFLQSPVRVLLGLDGFGFGLRNATQRSSIGDYGGVSESYAPAANLKMGMPSIGGLASLPYPGSESAPAPDVTSRMVVSTSYLSLLVKNVAESITNIKNFTVQTGGYMVQSNLSNPQDVASGQITLRIPQEKLDEALSYFRSLSVKVTSERLDGTDVTDEYVDIDARLSTLNSNLARFKEIMGSSTEISDILNVQERIFFLQDQIDKLKGRQNYLKQTARMAKITIYLSTDEFALPYAPSESWRPEVIFKKAVRSLIYNLQNIGTAIIWLGVFSVIWLPAVLIIIYLKKRFSRSTSP